MQVTDAASAVTTGAMTLTITPALAISSNSPLTGGTVGALYSQSLTATGGTPDYAWSVIAGTLPNGTTLSSAGVLSGTPTASGTFDFTVQAGDSATPVANATKALSVSIAPAMAITTTSPLPTGTVGTAYSQSFSVTGGTGLKTWSVSTGTLPDGLNLSSAGALSGTPTASGTFNFTVQATDAATATASKAMVVNITPTLAITSNSPLLSGTVGTNHSQPLSATGGTPSFTWSVSAGTLPTGVSLGSRWSLERNANSLRQFQLHGPSFGWAAPIAHATKAFAVTIDIPTPVDLSPASTLVNEGNFDITFTVARSSTATAGTIAYATAMVRHRRQRLHGRRRHSELRCRRTLKNIHVSFWTTTNTNRTRISPSTLSSPTGGICLGTTTLSTVTIHDGDADGDGCRTTRKPPTDSIRPSHPTPRSTATETDTPTCRNSSWERIHRTQQQLKSQSRKTATTSGSPSRL